MVSVFKKCSYIQIIFSNALFCPAYLQPHINAISILGSFLFSVPVLHEISVLFEINLTVFLHLHQHFVGPSLLINAIILSTLRSIPSGFDYSHSTVIFPLLLTSYGQLFCPLRKGCYRLGPLAVFRYPLLSHGNVLCRRYTYVVHLNMK